MFKVDVLRVVDPGEFWVSERNSAKFLAHAHAEIAKERDGDADNYLTTDGATSANLAARDSGNGTTTTIEAEIVGVYHTQRRQWMRGRIVKAGAAFGRIDFYQAGKEKIGKKR